MFSERHAFDQYHQETGESCDYDAMRSEIAEKHFDGNSNFEVTDVASVSADYDGGFDSDIIDAGGGD